MGNLRTSLTLSAAQADALLAEWLGGNVHCQTITPLEGGMINTVLRLDCDREPFSAVVKLNDADVSFAEEARMLQHLRDTAAVPCPAVYLESSGQRSIPYSFLLLETLPGENLWHAPITAAERDRIERELAEVLVRMHSHTRATFGGIDEPGQKRWADVFVPRIHEVRPDVQDKLPQEVLDDIDRALGAAEAVLGDEVEPALVHGDVWAANVMIVRQPDGWHLSGLLDPGAHYADPEIELAYLQNFGADPRALFETYTAQRPLRPGYDLRRELYWLHTGMIHVWLFGDREYCDATARAASELVRRTTRG